MPQVTRLSFTRPSTLHVRVFFSHLSPLSALWTLSRCWRHPLTLTHLPYTPLAAHSKLWLSVMGGWGFDSGEQWSGQVITGQANRGPMKHDNLLSPKRHTHTHTDTTDTHTHTRTQTEDTCKHIQHKYSCRLYSSLPKHHKDVQKFFWR